MRPVVVPLGAREEYTVQLCRFHVLDGCFPSGCKVLASLPELALQLVALTQFDWSPFEEHVVKLPDVFCGLPLLVLVVHTVIQWKGMVNPNEVAHLMTKPKVCDKQTKQDREGE